MAAKINKHLVNKTFEVYENISEGDVDVIKILLGGMKSADKTTLLLMIAEGCLEVKRPESMKADDKYVPVSHELVEGFGEFLREGTMVLTTKDEITIAQFARKHAGNLVSIQRLANEKANGVAHIFGQEFKDFVGALVSQVKM